MLALLVELVQHLASLPNTTNYHIGSNTVITVLTTDNNISSLSRHTALTWPCGAMRSSAAPERVRALFTHVLTHARRGSPYHVTDNVMRQDTLTKHNRVVRDVRN